MRPVIWRKKKWSQDCRRKGWTLPLKLSGVILLTSCERWWHTTWRHKNFTTLCLWTKKDERGQKQLVMFKLYFDLKDDMTKQRSTYSIARHRSYTLSKVGISYCSCSGWVTSNSETRHAQHWRLKILLHSRAIQSTAVYRRSVYNQVFLGGKKRRRTGVDCIGVS